MFEFKRIDPRNHSGDQPDQPHFSRLITNSRNDSAFLINPINLINLYTIKWEKLGVGLGAYSSGKCVERLIG